MNDSVVAGGYAVVPGLRISGQVARSCPLSSLQSVLFAGSIIHCVNCIPKLEVHYEHICG